MSDRMTIYLVSKDGREIIEECVGCEKFNNCISSNCPFNPASFGLNDVENRFERKITNEEMDEIFNELGINT